MTRATGILVGMLLMLAVFLLVLGRAEIPPPEQRAISREAELAAVTTELTAPAPTEDVAVEHALDTPDHNDSTAISRYRVWSPFQSQWAAQGFARRLIQATEVPVEVVNEGPGHYQVVFSYRDESERQAMVERIETVTGLELESP